MYNLIKRFNVCFKSILIRINAIDDFLSIMSYGLECDSMHAEESIMLCVSLVDERVGHNVYLLHVGLVGRLEMLYMLGGWKSLLPNTSVLVNLGITRNLCGKSRLCGGRWRNSETCFPGLGLVIFLRKSDEISDCNQTTLITHIHSFVKLFIFCLKYTNFSSCAGS